MKIDENELVEKLKSKDELAFKKFVLSFKDKAFSLLVGILKDKNLAEDALQESFIKFYFNISRFRAESSLSTWFYSIVYNTGLNFAKKKNTFTKLHIELDEELILGSTTPFEELQLEEESLFLHNAINKLPQNIAAIIILFYLEEFSINEINKITNLSTSNIKTMLYRGRKILKETILIEE